MNVGNENLLAARAEIEKILHDRNIAGHVVLHMPGFVENFGFYTPTYSKVKPVYEDNMMVGLHIKSDLSQYNGDKAAQRRDLQATAGMLDSMGVLLAQDAISLLDVAKRVNSMVGAVHTPLRPVVRPKGPRQ